MQNLAILTKYLTRIPLQCLDIFFPVPCESCGNIMDSSTMPGIFCPDCRRLLPEYPMINCDRCGARIPDPAMSTKDGCYCCTNSHYRLGGILTLGPYHKDARLSRMILSLKHGAKTWYAREFGWRLAQTVKREYPDTTFNAIVAVPLHRSRLRQRGYNQADLIAGAMADSMGIPSYRWLLRRFRRTKPQSGGRELRHSNVSGAFEAGGICRNAKIILVDDVVTTGATTGECARVLFEAGAQDVVVAACAWVPVLRNTGSSQ